MKRGEWTEPVIESGIPIPMRGGTARGGTMRAKLVEKLRAMAIGDSFLWHERSMVVQFAREAGVQITTRHMCNRRFRIWRTG